MSFEKIFDGRPSPADFDVFFPWACNQLGVEMKVRIVKVTQSDYVSANVTERTKKGAKSAAKLLPSKEDSVGKDKESEIRRSSSEEDRDFVKIIAVYDIMDNLVQLKFHKNQQIPRLTIKILSLIIKFHPHVTTIEINQGLHQAVLYDLVNLLPLSNITDVCLDNSYCKEANFYILLENENRIKNLSLARCGINDVVFEKIVNTLIYPLPSSKTLYILNVATNRITDLGISYLVHALRSNRHLCYLNLADNRLTDSGVSLLFNVLVDFTLTFDEMLSSRVRLMEYLKNKKEMIKQLAADLRFIDFDKRSRKKSVKPVTATSKKSKGLERELSAKSMPDTKSMTSGMDAIYLEKAALIIEAEMGDFMDAFSRTNTTTKDGIVYCYGNNFLNYLNLSYNNLSFITIKKLLYVLKVQQKNDLKPRGLVNVNIDGNNLPIECREQMEIDVILQAGLALFDKSLIHGKKRPGSKH